jgi:hypothetical protein
MRQVLAAIIILAGAMDAVSWVPCVNSPAVNVHLLENLSDGSWLDLVHGLVGLGAWAGWAWCTYMTMVPFYASTGGAWWALCMHKLGPASFTLWGAKQSSGAALSDRLWLGCSVFALRMAQR